MPRAILGTKVGMTQIFDETGKVTPVTVVVAGPCHIIGRRTLERDGYEATQVAFGATRRRTRPDSGQFKASGVKPLRFIRELPLDGAFEVGSEVRAESFQAGDKVDVSGISRGKGFAGGVRRWGFSRGPMAHGSKYHRGPGSLSSRTSGGGGRVHPGRKMPGHLGHDHVTVQSLEVMRVDAERNLLLIKGALPGPRGGLLTVTESRRGRSTR